MRIHRFVGTVVLGICASACSSEKDAPAPGAAQLTTFNVGLAPGYEQNVDERKPAIEAALAARAKDIDLLCVQEYWDEGHWQDLVGATAAQLPHVLRRPAEPGASSCTHAELDPLAACLETACPSKTGSDLVSCAMASCGPEVGALSSGCAACVTEDLTLPLAQIEPDAFLSKSSISPEAHQASAVPRWVRRGSAESISTSTPSCAENSTAMIRRSQQRAYLPHAECPSEGQEVVGNELPSVRPGCDSLRSNQDVRASALA